jgi:hypothetical protein
MPVHSITGISDISQLTHTIINARTKAVPRLEVIDHRKYGEDAFMLRVLYLHL